MRRIIINEIPRNVGVLVPVPKYRDKSDEFEIPTPITNVVSDWKLAAIHPARQQIRNRSMTELLFCMLRSACKQG